MDLADIIYVSICILDSARLNQRGLSGLGGGTCGVSIGPEKNPITININLEMQSTLHDRNKKLQNRQNRAKK